MDSRGSVSRWLEQLKGGQPEALQPLWERYFHRLVGLARTKARMGASRWKVRVLETLAPLLRLARLSPAAMMPTLTMWLHKPVQS